MKKKTRNQMALVQGDCQWLIFTGRNYKVGLQKTNIILQTFFKNWKPIIMIRIKASEMLVAPRISECFGLGLL